MTGAPVVPEAPASSQWKPRHLVIAVPEGADPNAVVRPAASTAPFTARPAFTEPIVPMPTTASALARPMVAVDTNNSGSVTIQKLAYMGGCSTCS
jgi:hypothetical protein